MAFVNGVFTGSLSGTSFSITRDLGIRGLSLRLISGTVTFIGSMKVEGLTPSARTLEDGSPFTVASAFAIDQFDIDATAGVCEITLIR